jgi:ATP-dependent Clp protease ATP-binding subunit ClpB
MEKADTQIFNTFLQVFDDGRLTDGQGRTVDFTNTVIIMTSNVGSDLLLEQSAEKEKRSALDLQDSVWERLRQSFRPEFLNRIDQIILYEPLSEAQLRQIVELQLTEVISLLASKNVTLQVDDSAKTWLAKNGYDPAFGARPLRRLIQSEVLDKAAMLMLDREGEEALEMNLRLNDKDKTLELT